MSSSDTSKAFKFSDEIVMNYVDGNLSLDQVAAFEERLENSGSDTKKEIYRLIKEFRLANQAILIQEKKKLKIPGPFLKKLINIERRVFNGKIFSDKQVMDFVDGNSDAKTTIAINTVLKFGNATSKKLAKRIDEMKKANSAMLLSTRKKMEMPKDFSEKLKELEKSKKNNVVQFIARPRAYINYISSGAIAEFAFCCFSFSTKWLNTGILSWKKRASTIKTIFFINNDASGIKFR